MKNNMFEPKFFIFLVNIYEVPYLVFFCFWGGGVVLLACQRQ